MSFVNQPHFKTFHGKSGGRAHRNGVQPIGVTVEIHFHNGAGIKNTEVGAATGDGFILGPVHKYFPSFKRSGQRYEILDSVRAGHRAAHPAAVKAGIKKMAIGLLTQIGCLRMRPVSKIVGWQQIMVIHYGDQMGCSDASHLILFGVQLDNFAGV